MQLEWRKCANGRNRAANHHLFYLLTTNIFQRVGGTLAPIFAYRSLAEEHNASSVVRWKA